MGVWEDRFEPFRQRGWMKTGECQSCPDWAMCQGNSFHLRDFESREGPVCEAKCCGLLEARR